MIPEVTNPKDKVGAKKAPLHLVPAALVIGVAEVMADGAEKYGPYNWREESIGFNTYLAAIERHLLALREGQDCSADSGHHHLKAIGANVAILLDAMAIGRLVDDRSPGPASLLLEELDKSVVPEA
jgi:hypothetical protein